MSSLSKNMTKKLKTLNIIIPMAGAGLRFKEAGYTFPKPLIDINGKPMISLVAENLKPKKGKFEHIFICQKEHYDKYSLREIFENSTGGKNYKYVQLTTMTEGAACTILTAVDYINNDQELIIANSDQIVDGGIDDFIDFARKSRADGAIMTFQSSHPRWSYAKVDEKNRVIEVAEKRVISDKATVGIYYFREGRKFVEAAQSMILKNIRVNNEFYVCPAYNELILSGGLVKIYNIEQHRMHGLGTPEDLNAYFQHLNSGQ